MPTLGRCRQLVPRWTAHLQGWVHKVFPDTERWIWSQRLHEVLLGVLCEPRSWTQPLRSSLCAQWASNLCQYQVDSQGCPRRRWGRCNPASHKVSYWQTRWHRRWYWQVWYAGYSLLQALRSRLAIDKPRSRQHGWFNSLDLISVQPRNLRRMGARVKLMHPHK